MTLEELKAQSKTAYVDAPQELRDYIDALERVSQDYVILKGRIQALTAEVINRFGKCSTEPFTAQLVERRGE